MRLITACYILWGISLISLAGFIKPTQGIKWLALSRIGAIASQARDPAVCDQMKGSLIKKQVKFCKRNPGFMDSVRLGAVRAIDECQYQFRSRRWNCSTLQDEINTSVDFIKQQLGQRITGADMTKYLGDLPPGGLPAMPSSSLYSRESLSLPSINKGTNTDPTFNMHNSFNTYRDKQTARTKERRNSRSRSSMQNVRRGRRLSRKTRRGTEEPEKDEKEATSSTPDTTKVETTISKNNKNNSNNKLGKKGRKNRKKIKTLEDWKAAMGPYPVVSPGTREASFVHAISSAGVAHAVTRACSSGELENCGCDRSLRGMSPEGFQWSGCSDNVDFGITFSRTFVDARDRRQSRKKPKNPVPLMNLHNNEAGRKLLERNMKVECKCHGVSGSCELKTCWRSLASFRMIGAMLKEKFDGAHEVRQKRKNGRRMLQPRFHRFKPHTDTDLVYLQTSPDYCEYDVQRGSLGTHGRECDPTSQGINGCDLLCCNRGYTTRRERRVERCKCKFHWCCYVECEECIRDVQISTCN